jgi:hypothetical protein
MSQLPTSIFTGATRPDAAPLQRARGPHPALQPVAGAKRPPSSTPPADPPAPTSASTCTDVSTSTSASPLHTRRRLHKRARYVLNQIGTVNSTRLQSSSQPPSPLFFSSSYARPHLPARFSSSEAAAKMLGTMHGDEGGIKTVTLARGSLTASVSTTSTTSITSAHSANSANSGRSPSNPSIYSPDIRDRPDPLKLLASIGIVELLEQDTRPVFVVDLSDPLNYAPESSHLNVLFANNVLRSSPSIWESIAGPPPERAFDQATTHAINQFRGWLMTNLSHVEGLDINPPPVEHGGVTWSSCTLRDRLRVVSGSVPAVDAPSTKASVDFAIPSVSSTGRASIHTRHSSSLSLQASEPQDYFSVASNLEEPNPSPTLPRNHTDVMVSSVGSNKDESAPHVFPPDGPSVGTLSSFTNECVLRAHSAGDVDPFLREQTPPKDHDMGFFDWTRLSISSSLPPHIQFARAIDWASTPLGPIEHWSSDLRAMCNLIM